jgi:hypothetical protein
MNVANMTETAISHGLTDGRHTRAAAISEDAMRPLRHLRNMNTGFHFSSERFPAGSRNNCVMTACRSRMHARGTSAYGIA